MSAQNLLQICISPRLITGILWYTIIFNDMFSCHDSVVTAVAVLSMGLWGMEEIFCVDELISLI